MNEQIPICDFAACATCGEAHTADSQCPMAIAEREAAELDNDDEVDNDD